MRAKQLAKICVYRVGWRGYGGLLGQFRPAQHVLGTIFHHFIQKTDKKLSQMTKNNENTACFEQKQAAKAIFQAFSALF